MFRSLYLIFFVQLLAFPVCAALGEDCDQSFKENSSQNSQTIRYSSEQFGYEKNALLLIVKTKGFFVSAGQGRLETIYQEFVQWIERKNETSIDSQTGVKSYRSLHPDLVDVEHVSTNDAVSYDELIPSTERFNPISRRRVAIDFIKSKSTRSDILKNFGFDGVAPFAIVHGFAGLWTRGGGQVVKGLVPVNLSEVVDERQAQLLNDLSQVLADKSIADTDSRKIEAKEIVHKIIQHASSKQNKKPAALLKLLQAAELSRETGFYVPLDFWTSRHTHFELLKYLNRLRLKMDDFVFHEDPKRDAQLKVSLKNYLEASDSIDESHVLGLQIEVPLIEKMGTDANSSTEPSEVPHFAFPPINSKHGLFRFSASHPFIGEGAGMYAPYLDFSGRREQLLSMGVKSAVFQNNEVFSPLHEEFFVFAHSEKPMSLTVVPTQPGHTGGAPYLATFKDGSKRFVMFEDSNVPEWLKEGNKVFNANTSFISLEAQWNPSMLAFEKADADGYRVKVNAGDPSIDLPMVLIKGSIPTHYVNLKSYKDYINSGTLVVLELLGSFETQK